MDNLKTELDAAYAHIAALEDETDRLRTERSTARASAAAAEHQAQHWRREATEKDDAIRLLMRKLAAANTDEGA